jgi:GR25 family glycosyltransferase involved in LPS biosynthesis
LSTESQRQELAELERELVQSRRYAERLAMRDEAGPWSPYEVFGINLDRDGERWQQLAAQFGVSGPALRRIPGVPGRYLPDSTVRRFGKRVSPQLKGTLGCFLGHVAAWEAFLATDRQAALIVEDDATFRYELPQSAAAFGIPENYDLCFITSGMAVPVEDRAGTASDFMPMPVAEAIRALWPTVRVPGGQGYVLSRTGAEALLRRTEEDGFFGDVDWRLVAYCMEGVALESLPMSTFAHQALAAHFDVIAKRPPMRGYSLSPGIAFPGVWGSVRIAANRAKLHAHLT